MAKCFGKIILLPINIYNPLVFFVSTPMLLHLLKLTRHVFTEYVNKFSTEWNLQQEKHSTLFFFFWYSLLAWLSIMNNRAGIWNSAEEVRQTRDPLSSGIIWYYLLACISSFLHSVSKIHLNVPQSICPHTPPRV